MTETVKTGRNEPCPCGSGKKYKRCCGVNAAPKLSAPAETPLAAAPSGGFNPHDLGGMDPQLMLQFTQALQRLPKGQMQRLQAIMRKAMNGRDVTAEAQEFERTLPLEFQTMMRSFSAAAAAMGQSPIETPSIPAGDLKMTEEEARALVAKAAEQGTLPKEQAEALLATPSMPSTPEALPTAIPTEGEDSSQNSPSRLGRFFRGFSGKKEK